MVGYCVAAHCRPSQTRRLILRLLADDPSCRVVLHYDQQQERLDLVELADPRITTVPQRYVPWGTFAMVELFMEMMRPAVEELPALTSCSSQGRTTPPQHPRPGTRACPLRRLGSGQSAGCRVLTILSARREVLSFFGHVPCPDEACFQTILWNAKDLTSAPNHARFIR